MNEVLLADKYALLRRLGRGGMAEVFLAKQVGVGGFEKLVVVKRPLPAVASDPHFRAMFLEEARMAADLRHPNIVSVLEVDEADGLPFLVMEYLHGRDVARVVRRCARQRSPLPLAHALQIVIDIASGLDYAHKKLDLDGEPLGLVHRDISPQNLFLTFHGRTVLVDFGIAKARGRSVNTEAGMLKGKCCYMSPEQVRGDALDHRSDLFALGIVLFELCTMKPLFRRKSDLQALQAVLACDVPRPSSVAADLDPRLDEIIQKTLASDPDDRFADCDALLRAIEDFMDQRRILHSGRRLARFARRLFAEEADDEAMRLDPGEDDTQLTQDDVGDTPEDAAGDVTLVIGRGGATDEEPGGFAPPAIDLAARTNLAHSASPLIGREQEMESVRRAFRAGARVVTLAGPAGIGTSRIAIAHGHERLDELARHGGVWIARCTQSESMEELVGAVARALHFSPPPELGADARARHSAEMMAHRGRMLLILDGCDRVPAVDLVVDRWLTGAKHLSILITSHHAMGIEGETVINVGPLAVPGPENAYTCASVQLLENYLAAAGVSDLPAAVLADIASRVDGVPLALEIAAGHIARDGAEAFTSALRTGGAAVLDGLAVALQSSWQILSAAERTALGQLCVLHGSFDTESASAIIAVPGSSSVALLDALVRKSLVHRFAEPSLDGELRMTIMATVRAMARDRLDPDARLAAAGRRSAHLLPRCVSMSRGIDGPGGRRMLARLALERDNLVAIAELALEAGGEVADALHATTALEAVLRGEVDLHLTLLDRAIAVAERRSGDRVQLASAYEVRADLHRAAGRWDAAQADLDQALHLARDQDLRLEGIIYRNLAVLKRKRGDAGAAMHDAKAALGIFRRLGDRHMEARARLELGRAHMRLGHAKEAKQAIEDALRTFRLVGDRRFEARALARLAQARALLGDAPVARVLVESAVAILQDMGERHALGRALELLGDLNLSLGASDAALHAWTWASRELGAAGAHAQRVRLMERAARALCDTHRGDARDLLEQARAAALALADVDAVERITVDLKAL